MSNYEQPVDDVHLVQVTQSTGNFGDVEPCARLAELLLALQMKEQLESDHLLVRLASPPLR